MKFVGHISISPFVPDGLCSAARLPGLSPTSTVSSEDRYISNHRTASRVAWRSIGEVSERRRPASRIELIARFNIVRRTSPRCAPDAARRRRRPPLSASDSFVFCLCVCLCVDVWTCAIRRMLARQWDSNDALTGRGSEFRRTHSSAPE